MCSMIEGELAKLKLLKLKQKRRSPGWLFASDGGITAPFAAVPKSKRHDTIMKDSKEKNDAIRIVCTKFKIL